MNYAEKREKALIIWEEQIKLIPSDVQLQGALWDCQSEMREVAEAAPELSGKALERAEAAEAAAQREKPFDVEAGWARFKSLIPNTGSISV